MTKTSQGLGEIRPVTLAGKAVQLEPLQLTHVPLLWDAAKDSIEATFRWIGYRMQTLEDFREKAAEVLAEQDRGLSVPFVTIHRDSGKVVGQTRFMNIDSPNRRVEIGSTWIAPAWQRTPINTEAKFLMLRHAFEQWGCLRVELKTDSLNQKSRNAILRIGAKEEGTLRQHMVTWDGRRRDSIYFSILDTEWPEVNIRLQKKLDP